MNHQLESLEPEVELGSGSVLTFPSQRNALAKVFDPDINLCTCDPERRRHVLKHRSVV